MTAGLSVKGDFPSAGLVPPSVQAEKRPQAWQEIRSSAGGFRIEFPGVPQHTNGQVQTDAGLLEQHHWAMSGYEVGFVELVPSVVRSKGTDLVLRDAVDGGVRSANGTLLSEVPITVAGHPAREVLIATTVGTENYTVRARVILAGSRLYSLFVIHRTNSRPESGEVERFLNSFRVIDR